MWNPFKKRIELHKHKFKFKVNKNGIYFFTCECYETCAASKEAFWNAS